MAAVGAVVVLVVSAVYVRMLRPVSVRMLGLVFVPVDLPARFCSDLVFVFRFGFFRSGD
ncbi:hypothetical protein RHMOL_Rhmol08G0088600 [Rhododendron molle]|uniref:Uncharacterized protein n=1 Tax=Rhododendron molle TaxID=49168 RepID=A0ACC0MMG6_RHOML|nr:hypothetical protein RHMOL_Rhmol08G0088600 [Rhododendron molle]